MAIGARDPRSEHAGLRPSGRHGWGADCRVDVPLAHLLAMTHFFGAPSGVHGAKWPSWRQVAFMEGRLACGMTLFGDVGLVWNVGFVLMSIPGYSQFLHFVNRVNLVEKSPTHRSFHAHP